MVEDVTGGRVIDGDKLRFYLERRQLIDDWAALAKQEPAEASRFLASLGPEIVERFRAVDDDLVIDAAGAVDQGVIGVRRRAWPVLKSNEFDRPLASVALAWWPESVRFEGARVTAWAGLRVERAEATMEQYEAIRAALPPKASGPFNNRGTKDAWLAWCWVPCTTAQYWDNLEPYAFALLERLVEAWRVFASLVDNVLASGGTDSELTFPTVTSVKPVPGPGRLTPPTL